MPDAPHHQSPEPADSSDEHRAFGNSSADRRPDAPADTQLDAPSIRDLLDGLGARLGDDDGPVIEILLGGGAGGMLAGRLKAERTTVDCDVMIWAPRDDWPRIKTAADELAADHGLSHMWFNNGAHAFHEALPPDWRHRRELVLESGGLRVFVPARRDFIITKVVAGRVQDFEDLVAMAIERDEWLDVRTHLQNWPWDHWPDSVLAMALDTVADFLGQIDDDDRDGGAA